MSNTKISPVVSNELTIEQQIEQAGSKSNLIRLLYSQGKKKSEIAKAMGIRYQFVRNVLERDSIKELKDKITKLEQEVQKK